MSRRTQAAFYAAVAGALLPDYREWASGTGHPHADLLDHAIGAAYHFAITGTVHRDHERLLRQLEEFPPDTDSDVVAQDCWICADVSLRLVTEDYPAADAAWYVLEPMFGNVSEQLFGVTDVGSEDAELEAQALKAPALGGALTSCSDALAFLTDRPEPSAEDLASQLPRLAAVSPTHS